MGKRKKKETLFLTSVNYTEAGPFTKDELAARVSERLLTWDTYVLRQGETEWRNVREMPELCEMLEAELPLKIGDTGPAGGMVISCFNEYEAPGYRYVEAAPFDAGFVSWDEAVRLCKEFSFNGYNDWRLPTEKEITDFACRTNPPEKHTVETVWHWSSEKKGENAAAVVTQENRDKYQPRLQYPMGGYSGGYYVSEHGPCIGKKQMYPLFHHYCVRPVREFFHKKLMEGTSVYVHFKNMEELKKSLEVDHGNFEEVKAYVDARMRGDEDAVDKI